MSDEVRHGGQLALDVARAYGAQEMFTLSGGHVFPLYDAAHRDGFPIYDVRHEQTAVFAAEGVAKLGRRLGLAVLTAGPGVTNGVSAITTAHFNGSPVLVLGGRAPNWRWGSGSLQELDHVPIVASLTRFAATASSAPEIQATVAQAAAAALGARRGPAFVDVPIDAVFGSAAPSTVEADLTRPRPDDADVARAARLLADAERPVVIVGSDVYADGAWDELRAAAEALRLPVVPNGMGRGCLPADHELAFSRARRIATTGADVVAVVGTPLDFRLGFGDFGTATVVHAVASPELRAGHVTAAASPAGDLRAVLAGWAAHGGPVADHEPWLATLRAAESVARAAEEDALTADGVPLSPARVYGELRRTLARDAVVIGDGGDFVSYAGKYLDAYEPGCWLDPGPYGCLGIGPGYAMAARLSRPDAQVCLLLGDGAAGFSLMDVDSLVRHRLPVVIVVGNNGIWGLEKHPMRQMYGYDVAADLQPELRYDDVVRALGGAGETVREAAELKPALERAFAAGTPYLVNVLTDPEDVYPRSSSLA